MIENEKKITTVLLILSAGFLANAESYLCTVRAEKINEEYKLDLKKMKIAGLSKSEEVGEVRASLLDSQTNGFKLHSKGFYRRSENNSALILRTQVKKSQNKCGKIVDEYVFRLRGPNENGNLTKTLKISEKLILGNKINDPKCTQPKQALINDPAVREHSMECNLVK